MCHPVDVRTLVNVPELSAEVHAMSDTSTTRATSTRLDVQSPDGTPLAVWVDGDGPALVLVHGCPSEHTTFDPLVAELRPHVTSYAMDRRGSGASGDTAPYAIEREFEDVAAVVETVAARTGGPVALWGHSYGCNPAMGGAVLSANVHHLVLYEPSFGLTYRPGAIDAIERAVAAGDAERAIRAAFVDTGVMTEEDFEAFEASPRWPNVVASAPTLPRECRVENDWVYQPGHLDAISAPTLLLTGSKTDPELAYCTQKAAAAIPDAHTRVLDGHGHFAYKTDPAMVAAIIRDFITT
jgi:pimeloyl-ACP methyl ester carboxylesterase